MGVGVGAGAVAGADGSKTDDAEDGELVDCHQL